MDLERFLAGNVALGLALAFTLAALARANRPFLRDVARDPDAPWRLLARLAVAAAATLLVWGTVADNWRRLLSLPYHHSRRFPSERIDLAPTPDAARRVTLILVALTLLLAAALVARHVGGYGLQLALLLGGGVLWTPLFVLRQRLDLNLAFGVGDNPSPASFLGYGAFLLLAWVFDVAVLLLCFAALLAAVALPVTLLLDLTRLRSPRPTTDALPFFTSLAHRSDPSSPNPRK